MTRKMPVIGAMLTMILIPASYGASTMKPEPKVAAVATVNGHAVTQATLDEKIEQLYPSMSAHGRQGGPADVRQKALEQVIVDELIWQEAVRGKTVVSFERVQREMVRIRKQCGPRDFDAGLRAKDLTRLQYIKLLQRSMTIEQAIKRHVDKKATVTPAEARAFYNANQSRFYRPDRVRMRLILVAVNEKATAVEEQAARKKADGLYEQLKNGKDFEELAWEASDDEYRWKGGDVGWMHKGSLDPDFEPKAFSLPIGEIAPPFRTPPGYSIMRVEAREPAKEMSYDEVHEMLIKQLTAQKTKKLQQAWEAALQRDAQVAVVGENAAVKTVSGSAMNASMIAAH